MIQMKYLKKRGEEIKKFKSEWMDRVIYVKSKTPKLDKAYVKKIKKKIQIYKMNILVQYLLPYQVVEGKKKEGKNILLLHMQIHEVMDINI